MQCKVPGTAREIVESIIEKYEYTVKQIGEMIGVTGKTISRVRRGGCPHPNVHINLIQLYLNLYYQTLREE